MVYISSFFVGLFFKYSIRSSLPRFTAALRRILLPKMLFQTDLGNLANYCGKLRGIMIHLCFWCTSTRFVYYPAESFAKPLSLQLVHIMTHYFIYRTSPRLKRGTIEFLEQKNCYWFHCGLHTKFLFASWNFIVSVSTKRKMPIIPCMPIFKASNPSKALM